MSEKARQRGTATNGYLKKMMITSKVNNVTKIGIIDQQIPIIIGPKMYIHVYVYCIFFLSEHDSDL